MYLKEKSEESSGGWERQSRMWSDCQREHSVDECTERDFMLQSISPSLQRQMHFWEFSGEEKKRKKNPTHKRWLQRHGKRAIWSAESSFTIFNKWPCACVAYSLREQNSHCKSIQSPYNFFTFILRGNISIRMGVDLIFQDDNISSQGLSESSDE